jgi:hypothetical protein
MDKTIKLNHFKVVFRIAISTEKLTHKNTAKIANVFFASLARLTISVGKVKTGGGHQS